MFRCYLLPTLTVTILLCVCTSNGFTIRNSALSGHILKTFTNFDCLECIQLCNSEPRCLSYNFLAAQNMCELNDFTFAEQCEADRALIKTSGWIYHQLVTAQEMAARRRKTRVQIPRQNITANITCDDAMKVYIDNKSIGDDNGKWQTPTQYVIPGDAKVISVEGEDRSGIAGILGSFSDGRITNESWKCTNLYYPEWYIPDFDDHSWPNAVVVGKHGDGPWNQLKGIDHEAKWIWTADNDNDDKVYCRLLL